MLYIKEIYSDNHLVELKVDGTLNNASLPTLQKIMRKHFSSNKRILLKLEDIVHCDRSCLSFLRECKENLELVGMSEFLRLGIETKSSESNSHSSTSRKQKK
ncbi:MAG: hypothetical protein HN416_08215 [Nitrospina sp.]|jgi:ABC-type transporter Mla MlaB component|nr:hypothetical protein [Nitrospina sp.]